MFNKIRKRIVIVTLLSVFIVLVGVIGILNWSNYRKIVDDVNNILSTILLNNGSIPENLESLPIHFESKELPYETRYFYVSFDPRGEIMNINLDHVASVSANEAVKMAYEALNSDRQSGFINKYRFQKSIALGNIAVAMTDCNRSLTIFYNTLTTSLIYSGLGYLLVILLSVFLSSETLKVYEIGDKKQKQFITDAGHEIKTPIAIIKADAYALELDYGTNEWCTDIQEQTERLTKLTQNLITLAKMEENQNYNTYELVDISEVVSSCIKSFKSTMKSKHKICVVSIEENIKTKCDPKEIGELMDILLDNAVKYSSDNSDIKISLSGEKNIVISVINDVPLNFDSNIALHMFDRFYRGDSEKEGYGIGLSVAKAISQKYSGKISANIQDNKMIITVSMKRQL